MSVQAAPRGQILTAPQLRANWRSSPGAAAPRLTVIPCCTGIGGASSVRGPDMPKPTLQFKSDSKLA